MTAIHCTMPGCQAVTAYPHLEAWHLDASGEWCPEHAPEQLPIDTLTLED